ncbi:hypothetical protein C5B85_01430 [Pseudoclavibacter sp. AY1F1]|uniref:hypothetical protein n=1 Tax=Pseudoclavibacter sp. AY1F1 TaxID=2080583 RepID=UPI000CE81A20|nr:hypothetical protein [Pseudoclavibacter sp. AY1F1]PPF46968.1 hypothetical protein C5B85_01430 [Pseudoclavibacter sp. AY1F1]
MIAYSDLGTLDEEQQERIQSLFERSATIWDLPEDEGKIEVWDEFVEDCERASFPHLIASARFGQYTTLVKAGLAGRALDAYAKLMQVIHRHGDLIAPDNVDRMLGSVATATMTLLDDPTVPLLQITRVVDLVEQQVKQRGTDIVGVYVARAAVAAATGDADATFDWISRWRAVGSEEWRPDSSGVIQMEVPLIARFDVPRATVTLEQRLRMLDIDPEQFDADTNDASTVVRLLTMLAFFYVHEGRRGDADRIVEQLVAGVGIDRLATEAVTDYLIPVLEERPADALVAVDHTLQNLHLDTSDWEALAAVARSRILANPDGEEGRLLQALAEEAATAQDARGSTDIHRRELNDFWWVGLPEHDRPALVGKRGVWDDVEERAERILAAGWLPRRRAVSLDDPPISIKHRYVSLLGETMDLLATESADEATDLKERLTARAEQLKCATSRYCIPLLHGLRAGQQAQTGTLVRDFERSQLELVTNAGLITDSIQAIGERFFAVTVEQAVADPEIPWVQIDDLIDREVRVRETTRGPASHVLLARAEIAAHRDDAESLRQIIARLQRAVAEEEELLDRVAVELEIVRLSARYAPQFAIAVATRVADTGAAEQVRAANAWLCWFGAQQGDVRAAPALAHLLATVDGDVTEFGPLPSWVLLEGLAAPGAELGPVIDAALEEADTGSASDLLVFAAAGSALLAQGKGDPRGPELREKVIQITEGLASRNGDRFWSEWIRDRWYPGDQAFEVSA